MWCTLDIEPGSPGPKPYALPTRLLLLPNDGVEDRIDKNRPYYRLVYHSVTVHMVFKYVKWLEAMGYETINPDTERCI